MEVDDILNISGLSIEDGPNIDPENEQHNLEDLNSTKEQENSKNLANKRKSTPYSESSEAKRKRIERYSFS